MFSDDTQVVKTSVTNNSSFQNYPHPDDLTTKSACTGVHVLYGHCLKTVIWRQVTKNDLNIVCILLQMLMISCCFVKKLEHCATPSLFHRILQQW